MQYDDTICHKINQCQERLQVALKTKRLDIEFLAKQLQLIQTDAIHMETALKINKELREKHNIDAEYRERMQEKNTPPGVNKFEKVDAKTPDKPKFKLTLQDEQGEIVYQNLLYGFIMCAVEKIDSVDDEGVITGEVQTLAVGHDLAILYAFDQLRQKFAGKFMEIGVKMQALISSGALKNKEFLSKLLSNVNV